MIVVGIDTATATGGVAVVKNKQLLGLHALKAEESHSENLLPALEMLISQLELDFEDIAGIAVTSGPGSFTGLRIGLAAAKALAYAWDVPVVGISKLFVQGWAYRGLNVRLVSVIDARRDHFYYNLYNPSQWTDAKVNGHPGGFVKDVSQESRQSVVVIGEHIDEALQAGHTVVIVGEGTEKLSGHLKDDAAGRLVVAPLTGAFDAAYVGMIGNLMIDAGYTDDLFRIAPHYLRRSEAERRCKSSPSS